MKLNIAIGKLLIVAAITIIVYGLVTVFSEVDNLRTEVDNLRTTNSSLRNKIQKLEESGAFIKPSASAWNEPYTCEKFEIHGSEIEKYVEIQSNEQFTRSPHMFDIFDKPKTYSVIERVTNYDEYALKSAAQKLLNIEGVRLVIFKPHHIVIAKYDTYKWSELRTNVINVVKSITSPGKG